MTEPDSDENEVQRVLTFLAYNPRFAHTTVTRSTLRAMLLKTDGWMTAQGCGWNIKSKHLGAGIYEVRLEERS